MADLQDSVEFLVWALTLNKDRVPFPTRVVRPRDVMARERERQRRKSARAELESDGWEEM